MRGSRPPPRPRRRARQGASRSRRAAARRGVAGFRRARKVRVVEAACGDSSRNTTSNGWSGALVSTALYRDALNADNWSSGTLTTISGSTSFAIETIGCPSATTWPTSNFTLVTTPSCDARSVVYSRRLRASSSFRASASAVARVVCALLCAFSSSEGLTEPSVFSAFSRCRSDSACRACACAAASCCCAVSTASL